MAYPPCALEIRLFDGTRQPFPHDIDVLYRVLDGNQQMLHRETTPGSVHVFNDLPFYDNAGDNYTVLVSPDAYSAAGYTPLRLSPSTPRSRAASTNAHVRNLTQTGDGPV
jgi:hypothetical protein